MSSDVLENARAALDRSYAPYSEYPVAAAIKTADGTIHTGVNLEIANLTNTLHAEELAIAKAVEAGHREFSAIGVSTPDRNGLTPCGSCRQTLLEFADPDLRVLCDDGDDGVAYQLGELLPAAMGPSTLSG